MKLALSAAFLPIALGAALMGYIRLAPTDPAVWHIPLDPRPAEITTPAPNIRSIGSGAYRDLVLSPEAARAALITLDARARATPRTIRFAGDPAQTRVTWQTRSLFWGFPDYTTAEITASGLTVYARLRFGSKDFGVNAARLRDWLTGL